jgi:uncharacterized protein (DUF2141 family)
MSRIFLFLSLIPALLLAGCGNAVNCVVDGDNLRGRITIGDSVKINSGAQLIVEWSTNSFATVPTLSDTVAVKNVHGMPSVSYSACIYNDGTYQLRAFQDVNGNGVLDAGEGSGRYDGTAEGNGSFIPAVLTPKRQGERPTLDHVDIGLDVT